MSFQPDAASLQAIIQMLNCSLLADNQVLERVRKEKEDPRARGRMPCLHTLGSGSFQHVG